MKYLGVPFLVLTTMFSASSSVDQDMSVKHLATFDKARLVLLCHNLYAKVASQHTIITSLRHRAYYAAPILPDPRLTPGETLNVTVEQLAQPGYSGRVRHVTEATKRKVYAEYGIIPENGRYEVDHLISLELGGSNSIKNLWPESYDTQPWNAKVKDKLENRLHSLVIAGKMDLRTAQQEEAENWIAEYQQVFHLVYPSSSLTAHSDTHHAIIDHHEIAPVPPAASSVGTMVWVNTHTGVYHYPGSRWYKRTKFGKLMTESKAKAEGDRPAANGQ